MPKWIESSWYYFLYGSTSDVESGDSNNWGDGIWRRTIWYTDMERLREKLDELVDTCNRKQQVIKAVFPLTAAEAQQYGQADSYSRFTIQGSGGGYGWGLGYGWGVTRNVGIAVLVEKSEDVTEDEYNSRIRRYENKDRLKFLKEQSEKLTQAIAEAHKAIKKEQIKVVSADKIKSPEIRENKGMLGSCSYIVDEKKFKSLGEAKEYIKKHKDEPEEAQKLIDALQMGIKEKENQLEEAEKEIAELQATLQK